MKLKFVLLIFGGLLLLPHLVIGEKPAEQKPFDMNDNKQVVARPESIKEDGAITSLIATSSSRAGEKINWQVISSGGVEGTSTNYILNGTLSQTAVDVAVSDNYNVHHGYWQEFITSGTCDCEPGEANGITPINILDVVYIINYKYKEGPAPIPYELCNADPDKNCQVTILDVVYIINYKYKEGPLPASCEEWVLECGTLVKK